MSCKATKPHRHLLHPVVYPSDPDPFPPSSPSPSFSFSPYALSPLIGATTPYSASSFVFSLTGKYMNFSYYSAPLRPPVCGDAFCTSNLSFSCTVIESVVVHQVNGAFSEISQRPCQPAVKIRRGCVYKENTPVSATCQYSTPPGGPVDSLIFF